MDDAPVSVVLEPVVEVIPAGAGVDDAFEEGGEKYVLHRQKERSKELVEAKRASVLNEFGKLCCEVCDFDFATYYGPMGKGYAECHHLTPLASLKESHKTRLSNLAIVCANCHRVIHRNNPMPSIKELREIVLAHRIREAT